MADFTQLNADDAFQMQLAHERGTYGNRTFAYNAETRDAYVGASYVERSAQNEGTFVFNANHECVGYVGNHVSSDGVWLYYSAGVAKWLGCS